MIIAHQVQQIKDAAGNLEAATGWIHPHPHPISRTSLSTLPKKCYFAVDTIVLL